MSFWVKWFAVLGFSHALLSCAGTLGAIDYHLCIKAAGQCTADKEEA